MVQQPQDPADRGRQAVRGRHYIQDVLLIDSSGAKYSTLHSSLWTRGWMRGTNVSRCVFGSRQMHICGNHMQYVQVIKPVLLTKCRPPSESQRPTFFKRPLSECVSSRYSLAGKQAGLRCPVGLAGRVQPGFAAHAARLQRRSMGSVTSAGGSLLQTERPVVGNRTLIYIRVSALIDTRTLRMIASIF